MVLHTLHSQYYFRTHSFIVKKDLVLYVGEENNAFCACQGNTGSAGKKIKKEKSKYLRTPFKPD